MIPSGSRNFLKNFISLRNRAIFSICVCTSVINHQIAWQRNTGHSHSVYNIPKFHLDLSNTDTIIQNMIK